jgi:hypothetical protein
MNESMAESRGRPILWSATVLLLVAPAAAQPVPKIGTCPSGYQSSGGYCAPSATARPALAKTGQCPSGYHASGGYCLGQQGARHAVHRVAACPVGYHVSGAYCLKNR